MNPNIQLIAVDLDGTTLKHTHGDQFVISARVKNAIQQATERGIRVCIATGRSVIHTRKFAQMLGVNAPCVCQQGGVIYDFATEREWFSMRLDRALAQEVVVFERTHPQFHAIAYQGDQIYITHQRYENSFYDLVGFKPNIVPDLVEILHGFDPEKILFILPKEEVSNGLKIMSAFVGNRASVVQSHALFVEVNPLGADKGTGLARLAQHLNIAQANVMAIGDEGNDATMVAWAGVGVALANGNPVTKANANWVAPSIDEDGAAVAIEKFALA